jgi:hypothetical protein
MDVRVTAAACLLLHRTEEAKAALEEAAKGKGLVPFEAQQALKRWEEGTWALDPACPCEISKGRALKNSSRSTSFSAG